MERTTLDKMFDHNTLKLLIALSIPVAYWVWWRYRRLSLLSRNGIPTPKGSFWTGNFAPLIQGNVPTIGSWIREYGKIVGCNAGLPTVIVADAELVNRIQVKDFRLFTSRRRIIPRGGADANSDYECSMVTTDISAKRWKEQRSLITTAFTSSKIKSSVPLISDAIDALMQNIREREEEEDFEIYDLYQRLTMDTIGRSAFGIHTNVQRDPNDPFFIATKDVFDDKSGSMRYLLLFINILFPEFSFFLYPLRRIQYHVMKLFSISRLHYHLDVCCRIIKQRKENIIDPANPWSRNDLLQQMLEATLTSEQMNSVSEAQLTAQEDSRDAAAEEQLLLTSGQQQQAGSTAGKRRQHHMNDYEVAANASLFFDAGFETTSTFLAFLTHVLVNRQDIQDRVRDEVTSLYQREGCLNYNTSNSLPFLDSVMYEALRYFPPVTAFVTRQSTVDYEYKDITIPADVGIEVAVYQLHHDPDYWEDPETFDAERFYGSNRSRASSPAFQAFGAGPRNCVGLRFAFMEAKMTICRVLREYKLIPGPRTAKFDSLQIAYKPVTMNPGNGVYVKAVPLLL